MSLVKAKTFEAIKPTETHNEIFNKIRQRRYQLLVHSLLYYELDINLVDDNTWTRWAHELVQLQEEYPEEANKVTFSEAFKNFNEWSKQECIKNYIQSLKDQGYTFK